MALNWGAGEGKPPPSNVDERERDVRDDIKDKLIYYLSNEIVLNSEKELIWRWRLLHGLRNIIYFEVTLLYVV